MRVPTHCARDDTDAPEPEACAYISGGPAGPTLEREQGLPLLKGRETDPTSPK